MKRINWLCLTGINLLFMLAIILPFIPGPANKLVIALSAVSQLAGYFGLLLVPIGIIWSLFEIRKWKKFAGKFNALPLYLFTIPLVAFLTRAYLVDPISDHSRSFAIERAEVLIANIEHYKLKAGQYPTSIQQLEASYQTNIPGPFIMGILDFRYNNINDHYSVSFSQWLECGSLEEIVLYDKRNLRNNLHGAYAVYDYKFDLCRVKGAFETRKTKYDTWTSFLID